jgi:hypothetical protein
MARQIDVGWQLQRRNRRCWLQREEEEEEEEEVLFVIAMVV